MLNSKVPYNNSRREFIQQMALMYFAAQVPFSFVSCKSDKNRFVGSGKAPYKIWEEMLMALQTCPDYLEGRMKSLVASKNAEAMFNFVRDEIYLMPAAKESLGYVGTQFKWGIKGALRYGMATPREKAELLNQMFSQAGMLSKVVFERTDIKPDEAMSFFLRPIQRKYDLDVSAEQWNKWKEELRIELEMDYNISAMGPDLKKTDELAELLYSFIPNKETLNPKEFDFRWNNYQTPTVEFQLDGITKYAHLFDVNVPFGQLKNKGKISEADPVKLYEETVEIKVTYREAIHPKKEIDLISGSWKSTNLIGNQIQFSCLNGLSLEQSTITPIGNLRVFTPALALQSFDTPIEILGQQSFIADPFTLEGKKILLPSSDKNKAPVVLSKEIDRVKKVTKIDLKAIPVYRSLVKLQVNPFDSEGNIVEGLQAGDFRFTDNNKPVQVLMESNQKTPRILILYDASFSMPKEYYGEKMDAFVVSLSEVIQLNFPAAIVDQWSTPSELFTWLLKASKTDYDLIIYATDGDNDDVYNEQDLATYQSGPPALILNVYNNNATHTKKTFDKMAEITNGIVLPAKEQNIVMQKVIEYINEMGIPPYTFTYYAIGDLEHEVVLKIDDERLHANDKFSLNIPQNMDDINQGIVGLYLHLKIGNSKTKRVLAGWDPVNQRDQSLKYQHFLETQSLIFGGATFYFEGEGPTLATSIGDLLEYKLSTRTWGEAILDNDIAKAKTEFEKGIFQLHPTAMALMAPIEEGITTNTYTFASGLRIGICKQQINIQTKKVTESFDFLPTSNYVSFTNDIENAFKTNLRKTAQLAVREASLYNNSTYNELKSTILIERITAINNKWFDNVKSDDPFYDYWYEYIYRGDGNYKIFDSTTTHKAFWQINELGELYGVLQDGTGGGSSEEVVQQLSDIMAVMAVYIALVQEMGKLSTLGGVSLSLVATYGVTLTKLYAIVCETLVVMDTTGMDDKIKMALKELAINAAKTIYMGGLGSAGNIMSGLDSLISLLGVPTNPYS